MPLEPEVPELPEVPDEPLVPEEPDVPLEPEVPDEPPVPPPPPLNVIPTVLSFTWVNPDTPEPEISSMGPDRVSLPDLNVEGKSANEEVITLILPNSSDSKEV